MADAALAKVGLDAFTVEGGESSVKQVLRGTKPKSWCACCGKLMESIFYRNPGSPH